MTKKIDAMLNSDTLSEQRSALEALTVFLEDGELLHSYTQCMIRIAADLIRASYSTAETIQKIVTVLRRPVKKKHNYFSHDSNENRQLALNAINICLKHSKHLHSIHYLLSNCPADDLRTIISGPEMVQKIFSMLDSETLSVQKSALEALTIFLEDGELLHSYSRCMI
jgi:hypothetical protein